MRLGFLLFACITLLTTPAAASAQQERVNPAVPAEGDTITVFRNGEAEIGTVTLTGITRDWDAFSSNHRPPANTGYVAFELQFENTGSDEFEINAREFGLQIDPGLLLDVASVRRPDHDPPLLTGTKPIAPGEVYHCTIIFAVPDRAPLSALYWARDDAFITIALLGEPA